MKDYFIVVIHDTQVLLHQSLRLLVQSLQVAIDVLHKISDLLLLLDVELCVLHLRAHDDWLDHNWLGDLLESSPVLPGLSFLLINGLLGSQGIVSPASLGNGLGLWI